MQQRAETASFPFYPRGLREEHAALYVGLGVSSFRTLVTAGDMPGPVWLTRGRKVWLREQLDRWLDARAGVEAASPAAESDNPWISRLNGTR